MSNWRSQLKHDPIVPLLSSEDPALVYFVKSDLLGEPAGPRHHLWQLPGTQKILRKQLPDGSWPRYGEKKHPAINYALIETWKNFRFLVELYGFTRQHPQARQAAEFLFSCQTEEGDMRGMLANQYATYYTGAIMALLVQAGYQDDPRIERGFQWLLSMRRQSDGGWTIPILTHKFDRATQYRLTSQFAEPVEPDRSQPFSHNWTGMVLRAFAVHPTYRHSEAAKMGAQLLKSRFFQPDVYSSYRAASYWLRFGYPFWWNNLVAALDSISCIGASKDDRQIRQALDWLIDHQEQNGLWKISYARQNEPEKQTPKVQATKRWVSLAICRVFKRLYG
ncbi:MAG: prenyltransferase/squalene oxidase repeat-containing protein [Anaerolineales bacterium]